MDINLRGLATARNGVKLLMEGIPACLSERQLHALFTPFGTVTSAHVVLPSIGLSPGFGYVYMTRRRDAEKACLALDGIALRGEFVSVQVVREETARV
ncbi:MAG TPA: RNA-binding protein [Nitrospiraceae bacterium]|nr:RNA-binding protein [Nitrospiraceae bacterium]